MPTPAVIQKTKLDNERGQTSSQTKEASSPERWHTINLVKKIKRYKVPFAKDLGNFLQHGEIEQTTQNYIKALLEKTSQELKGLEEAEFSYWPSDCSLEETAYLEFSWIPTEKALGFKFSPDIDWLEGYRSLYEIHIRPN